MNKKDLIKALRSNMKLYGYVAYSRYVPYSRYDGGYFQMVKSDFLHSVLQSPDDSMYDTVTITDGIIYIN